MGFLFYGEMLYKKGKDQVSLRCVNFSEASRIVEEIHKGICETHVNGYKMARQVMRASYYWLTLESDCIKYARKCHKCQIYSDKATSHGTTLAFLNVGHGCHWTHISKSF